MRPIPILIAASAVTLLISFWNRNDLPRNIELLPALADEPLQSVTDEAPFTVRYDDVDYRVEPQYDYELNGMVVSFRHHDGNSRMHRLSNDHLNMLDVCVVWGSNAANTHLQDISFWNGIFTCNVKTSDREAWDSFDIYKLSNNHLLSDDERVRDEVRDVRIGDQIKVRGYLASYESGGGGKRGTSTTRLDTGDGACETLFVKEFDIVRAATNYWRIGMYTSLLIFLASLVMYFAAPYKPH
ncbi:MAG TPA: hypothetical protein PKK10_13905 [Woeseiaceae bacterium]|nr:hypothetical protein [Woeseiaceae bacterium]